MKLHYYIHRQLPNIGFATYKTVLIDIDEEIYKECTYNPAVDWIYV